MQLQSENCECGAPLINDTDNLETVCSACGLVDSDSPYPSLQNEMRAYTIQEVESRARTGSPLSPLLHDRGLSTNVSTRGRDAMGRKLTRDTRIKMLRLRKWNQRTRVHSSADRNLSQALATLTQLGDKLHLPTPTREEAATIYRRVLAEGLVRGRSIDAIMAGSTYAAIRLHQLPHALNDMVAATNIPRKELSRSYRLIVKTLKLKMPRHDAKKKIPKIGNSLGLSPAVQEAAAEILRMAEKARETVGKDPAGMAAAALYIASRHSEQKPTQQQIGDAAGVTEVTIRNRYKSLTKYAEGDNTLKIRERDN